MWTISELKQAAKAAVKGNYWKTVLVGFLISLTVGSAATGGYSVDDDQINGYFAGLTDSEAAFLILTVVGFLATISLVIKLVKIFLLNPLNVGCKLFFKNNCHSVADLGDLGFAFKNGYMRMVGGVLLKNIFLCLWTLLFIVPGIIKYYSYRMVEYILADNPDMNVTDAITLSREMMNGHKWRTFLLDLSFIGWDILSIFTCGLLEIFWVAPYKCQAEAALYLSLKGQQ